MLQIDMSNKSHPEKMTNPYAHLRHSASNMWAYHPPNPISPVFPLRLLAVSMPQTVELSATRMTSTTSLDWPPSAIIWPTRPLNYLIAAYQLNLIRFTSSAVVLEHRIRIRHQQTMIGTTHLCRSSIAVAPNQVAQGWP